MADIAVAVGAVVPVDADRAAAGPASVTRAHGVWPIAVVGRR